MADCKQCLCEQVCRFNDGHNLYCKEDYECPHYKSASDVVEVISGKWVNDGEDWFCNRCNHNALCDKMTGEEVLSNICSHCGARMN